MREILFRGKREDNGEWIEGDLRNDPDLETAYIGGYDYFTADYALQREPFEHQVIPETVGEYTGLTDYNGKRIFEGDILQFNNNPQDLVKVIFGEFDVIDMETESTVDKVIGWHYEVIPTNDILSRIEPFNLPMQLTKFYIDFWNVKIIGNIHDNPELLEENAE